MPWCIYILQCSDDSYYVGHTADLEHRIEQHNTGRAAKHTRLRRPFTLVYSEWHATKTDAAVREKQLKKWTRQKKQALIEGNIAELMRLAKSHSGRAFAAKHL